MEADCSVLIVDDEEALLESYAAILSTRYEVATAKTGADAMETLDSQTDVVLLDRRMPEQSGKEILSKIRRRESDHQVVFCSAVVPDTDIVPVAIDAYLQKPVGPDELFETIDRQSRLAAERDSVREYAALEAKRRALEAAGTATGVAGDEQYQRLLEQIEQKEQGIDSSQIEVVSV